MPEGNVFLDNAGGGEGDVVGTLAEEGSLLLAGSFRERQGHRTIATAAYKGSAMRAGPIGTKVHSLSAGGGATLCAKAE
jgi:hypothetical protein